MDVHPVSWNNIGVFNLQSYKNNINSNRLTQEWEDWTWKHISARECLFYLRTHSWCVITHSVCVCVWESRWILFTLEESEMPGSPILKLTGPFGSNHQMCHGKTAMSLCKGRQDFASINIFLQGWRWMSFWLGLCASSSSRQVYRSFFWEFAMRRTIVSLSFHWHTYVCQRGLWSTNRDKREEEFYQYYFLQIGSSGN